MDPLDPHAQYSGLPQNVYPSWSPEDGLAESRVPGTSPFAPSHPTQPGHAHHYEARPNPDPYSTSVPNTFPGHPPPPLDAPHPQHHEDSMAHPVPQSHWDYSAQRRPDAASMATTIPYMSLPHYSVHTRSDLRTTGTNTPGDLPDVIATHASFSIARYQVPEQLEASRNRYDSTCSTTADTVTHGSMPFKIRKRRYQAAQSPLQPVRNDKTIRQERVRSLRMLYQETTRASSGDHSLSESLAQVTPYPSTAMQHSVHPATSYERVSSDAPSSAPSMQSSPASALSPHHQTAPWNSYSPQAVMGLEASRESSSSRSLSPLPSTATTSRSEDPQPSTVFIHSNVPRTAISSVQSYEDYPNYRSFFPLSTEEHRRLRIAMHDVMHSEWKRRNELEPTSAEVLQFSVKTTGADGTPSFKCLLYHDGEECGKTWTRAERMLAHLRGAIDLRPFACEGEGDLCNCGLRFFAEDTLQQHRKNTKTVSCQYCSASVTPRNIRRHYRANCPNYPAQGA